MTMLRLNPEYASKLEAVKSITRSGTTFTATRCDDTTFTFTQQDNNSLTGVKGNAESSYRTGNVNLTYPNIGTCPVANGGTGATTAANARSNLGANNAANLTAGTLPNDRIGLSSGNVTLVDCKEGWINYVKWGRVVNLNFWIRTNKAVSTWSSAQFGSGAPQNYWPGSTCCKCDSNGNAYFCEVDGNGKFNLIARETAITSNTIYSGGLVYVSK